MASKNMYSAVLDKNTVKVFNVISGAKEYSINLGSDTVVSGPVISGDTLSFVSKNTKGETRGKVYNLAKGNLKYSFSVR